jgi:hypothetical protein
MENCLFILSTENGITKSLSYKEAIKGHADKECTRANRKVRFPYLLKINSNIYFQNQIHNMKA